MKMFSKKNGTRVFPPEADFQVKQDTRAGAVFFETEPIDLSAYPVCRRHGISYRHNIFEHFPKRQITHQVVRDHVSGRTDPFVM